VAPRRFFAYETADFVLVFVTALIVVPAEAAQRALLDTNSSDWRRAHVPDEFSHLLRPLLLAHHPSHEELKKEQKAVDFTSGSCADAGSNADGFRITCIDQKTKDRDDSKCTDNPLPEKARAAEKSTLYGGSGSRRRSSSSGGSAAGSGSSRTERWRGGRCGARGGPGAQDEDTSGGGRIGGEQ